MTLIKKILVPLDLSPRSPCVAKYATSLAAGFGADVVFLHGMQNGSPLGPSEREVRDRIMNMTGGADVFLFREGPTVAAILDAAETERVDLILIPARGKPPLSLFFDGSITARVLRGAHCAVWAGSDNLLPLSGRPIRNIVCSLSLGPRASDILHWSARLARQLNARLSVIHISEALEPKPGLPGDEEWRCWLKKMVRGEIQALQTGMGTEAEIRLEAGDPLAMIPHLADHLQADLLVIGKSPRKRFLGDLRTLSYEIARRAPCPVASV